jgi:excisionase family DNA binding protein
MSRPSSTVPAVLPAGIPRAGDSSIRLAPVAGLIDISELSQRLSIAKGTLYNWVYLRRIPFVKAGRCLRFDYQQVLDALRQYPIIDTSASGRRII